MRSGPVGKASDQKAGRTKAKVLDIVGTDLEPFEGALLPDPPVGLSTEVLEEWHRFWATPMARAVQPSDLAPLRRLFQLRSDAADAHADCRAMPIVPGSMGQDVTNPRCTQAAALDKDILALEDRFGLNPQARLRLIGHDNENALLAARRARTEKTTEEASPSRADPRKPDAEPAASEPRRRGRRLDGEQPRPR